MASNPAKTANRMGQPPLKAKRDLPQRTRRAQRKNNEENSNGERQLYWSSAVAIFLIVFAFLCVLCALCGKSLCDLFPRRRLGRTDAVAGHLPQGDPVDHLQERQRTGLDDV